MTMDKDESKKQRIANTGFALVGGQVRIETPASGRQV